MIVTLLVFIRVFIRIIILEKITYFSKLPKIDLICFPGWSINKENKIVPEEKVHSWMKFSPTF